MNTLISNVFTAYNIIYLLIYENVLLKVISKFFLQNIIIKSAFIIIYNKRNENLWGDGFIFDFLQKKTIDIWIRKFLIYTGFLFSERSLFDIIIKFYSDNIIWFFHKFSIFETNNVSEVLNIIIYFYFTFCFIYLISTIFLI